jgi:hypothetical protein
MNFSGCTGFRRGRDYPTGRQHLAISLRALSNLVPLRVSISPIALAVSGMGSLEGDLLEADFWTVEVSHSDEDLFLKTDYFSVARNRRGEARGVFETESFMES